MRQLLSICILHLLTFAHLVVCFQHFSLITDLDAVISTKYDTRKLSKYLQPNANLLEIPLHLNSKDYREEKKKNKERNKA